MDDKIILKLSLGCCAFGIIILFLASRFATIPESTIPLNDGAIKVRGVIESVENYGSVSKITLKPENKVKVVLFGGVGEDLDRGDRVEVIGEAKDGELIGDIVSVLG